MYHLTKDYVRENVVQPLKRSNSVKSIGKYSDLAAEKIDSVLDVADKYVDKYLPDSGDFDTVGKPLLFQWAIFYSILLISFLIFTFQITIPWRFFFIELLTSFDLKK